MNLPLFSRIRSGKRWFWCVSAGLLEDLQFTGFSDTPEDALDDAKKAAGEVDQIGNWKARVALRQIRAERIREKKSNTQEAHQLEFVYDCWGVDSHHKHRIVKRTKKQIVVEKIPFHWTRKRNGTWRDFDVETFPIPLPSSTLYLNHEEALSLLETLEAALPHSIQLEIAGEFLSTREMQALLLELKVILVGGVPRPRGGWRKGF